MEEVAELTSILLPRRIFLLRLDWRTRTVRTLELPYRRGDCRRDCRTLWAGFGGNSSTPEEPQLLGSV